jgi:carboxyl-terminal processing protease
LWAAALFVAVAALAGGVFVRRAADARRSAEGGGPSAESAVERDYDEAVSLVSENYVDEVDYERATQAAIQGMLSTLDPHSTFFTKADFDRLRQDHESRFYGIGVSILRHRDGVYVKSAVEGTPAERAGLRYGDRIVEVDGKDARQWTSEQVSKAVRGERGEPVRVKVERAGSEPPLYFTIVRDAVPLPSIRTAYIVRPGTGYVALTGGFTQTTGEELQEALARLEAEGMRQLVLDLRNNPGGLLPQAVKVASQFLQRGQTVVSVRGRTENGGQTVVYKNTEFDGAQDFPVVVLVNRNSASASEIVAGAIQDHGRGLIVGETTFGKGLVQHVFELKPWGCGLTLTTQKYFTPYGRSIQRDYSSGSIYDYYVRHDAGDEPRPAQPSAPSAPVAPRNPDAQPVPTPQPTPPPHPTGPAVKTAAGRVFYGGGGITPDIEVKPIDVAAPARARIFDAAFYFARQLAAGQVAGFENYRVERARYGQQAKATDFPVNERVLEAFRDFLRRDAAHNLTPAQMDAEIDYARLRLREEIVSAAFGQEAGQRTLLDSDPQLLRALEAFPDARRLAEMVRSGAWAS